VFEALPGDDPQLRQSDITRARQLLSWEAEIEVREGLRGAIDHYTSIVGVVASR
jgi:dTDP-glucose 4,6-dehydratase